MRLADALVFFIFDLSAGHHAQQTRTAIYGPWDLDLCFDLFISVT